MKKHSLLRLLCVLFTVFLFQQRTAVLAEPFPFLTDDARYLTAEETEELSELLTDLYGDFCIRTAVYTEPALPDDCHGDAQKRVTQLYYQFDDFDGLIFYVSADRYYYFLTVGIGYEIFDRKAIEKLEQDIVPYLSRNDMAGAFQEYVSVCGDILERADIQAAEAAYAVHREEMEITAAQEKNSPVPLLLAVIFLPLLPAFILTTSKCAAMRTAAPQKAAGAYMRDESFTLNRQQDVFLHSQVVKTPIPQRENPSSSRSGGFSSGGRGPTGGSGGRF